MDDGDANDNIDCRCTGVRLNAPTAMTEGALTTTTWMVTDGELLPGAMAAVLRMMFAAAS